MVERDCVTALVWKRVEAWGMVGASMEEPRQTLKAIRPMTAAVWNVFGHGQFTGLRGRRGRRMIRGSCPRIFSESMFGDGAPEGVLYSSVLPSGVGGGSRCSCSRILRKIRWCWIEDCVFAR